MKKLSKLLGECVISPVLSHYSKNLKRRMNQCYSSVLQLSFIWQAKENISLRHEGKPTQETQRKEEPSLNFGFSFYVFFLLPLDLPYVNWASQECCLFYLRSSLQSSDLLLFYFPGLFPSKGVGYFPWWAVVISLLNWHCML